MTERLLSLQEAGQTLASLPDQFSAECPAIIITADDQRPLMTVMSYETYQEMLATIDSLQTLLRIIGNSDLIENVLQQKKEKAGVPDMADHTISWEEFKETFGWE
jgi:hypothetical protein